MKRWNLVCLIWIACGAAVTTASAQDPPPQQGGLSAEAIAQANNPLADMNALNIQDYFSPSLYGVDGNANSCYFRGVMVAGRQLIRATLPVTTVPAGDGTAISGLGDLNVFDAILLSSQESSIQLGVGPLVVIPTNTDDALGAPSTWQAGAAAVIIKSLGKGSLTGALVTWQTDFAGGDERIDTNLATAQVFLTMSFGGGWYFRVTPLSTFDFENDRYLVPVGFGAGKVFPLGSAVANIFIEPQPTIYHDGEGLPSFQILSGLNLQFPKK